MTKLFTFADTPTTCLDMSPAVLSNVFIMMPVRICYGIKNRIVEILILIGVTCHAVSSVLIHHNFTRPSYFLSLFLVLLQLTAYPCGNGFTSVKGARPCAFLKRQLICLCLFPQKEFHFLTGDTLFAAVCTVCGQSVCASLTRACLFAEMDWGFEVSDSQL